MESDRERLVTEDDLKRIIQRAAEIDALVEALRPRTDRPQLSFQLASLLGWATFFSAFTLMAPTIGDEALGMFTLFAAASAAIGGLITDLRSSRTSSTSSPSRPSLPAADQHHP